MYRKISLGLLVAALFIFARPAAAMTVTELQAQINAILAQIVALQEQIALLQGNTYSNATTSVTVHIKNDVSNRSSEGRSAQVKTSIGPSKDNSKVTSWDLKISCPSGVSLVVSNTGSILPQNVCGTTKTYYTADYDDINDGVVVLSAVATNKNDYDVSINYTLVAYNANGRSIGGDKDAVSLYWEGDDVKETIDVSSPVGGERYTPGQAIPLTFDVNSSDGKPDVAVRVLQHTDGKDLVVNEVFYPYADGFVKNGKNTLNFYPAKGSEYPAEKLVGEFRLEVSVGEIFCCKYWIEPTDSDITGWFTISYDKTLSTDPYEKVSAATRDGVLSQMASVLVGIQALLNSM